MLSYIWPCKWSVNMQGKIWGFVLCSGTTKKRWATHWCWWDRNRWDLSGSTSSGKAVAGQSDDQDGTVSSGPDARDAGSSGPGPGAAACRWNAALWTRNLRHRQNGPLSVGSLRQGRSTWRGRCWRSVWWERHWRHFWRRWLPLGLGLATDRGASTGTSGAKPVDDWNWCDRLLHGSTRVLIRGPIRVDALWATQARQWPDFWRWVHLSSVCSLYYLPYSDDISCHSFQQVYYETQIKAPSGCFVCCTFILWLMGAHKVRLLWSWVTSMWPLALKWLAVTTASVSTGLMTVVEVAPCSLALQKVGVCGSLDPGSSALGHIVDLVLKN